ncbi:MAG: DUF502 domain-containing protein [Gemmatimonadetes bacterium]|nr:DUF502 domain-containing protein [Gemmatimonadota bacterium]
MTARGGSRLRLLRRYLLEGLAVVGPIGLTVIVLRWIFVQLDGILGEFLYAVLGRPIPGLGLAALLLLLLGMGWVTHRAVGARLVSAWDEFLNRLPLARSVYRASRQVVRSLLGQERYAFQEVVLFEYPSVGRWALGMITGIAPRVASERFGEEAVTVYMPTAPNPMSGYLAIVPRSSLIPLPVSVEEAFTYVVSCGAVSAERVAEDLARSAPGLASAAVLTNLTNPTSPGEP